MQKEYKTIEALKEVYIKRLNIFKKLFKEENNFEATDEDINNFINILNESNSYLITHFADNKNSNIIKKTILDLITLLIPNNNIYKFKYSNKCIFGANDYKPVVDNYIEFNVDEKDKNSITVVPKIIFNTTYNGITIIYDLLDKIINYLNNKISLIDENKYVYIDIVKFLIDILDFEILKENNL